ncbi:MAG: biotin--[acetyl-CoA-carboxylase] ligase [Planctomycetes bacterium]|nr:biotin--[acetyl-CoA-carboxylase] ligase [Planctomycetota bacterium]
MSADDSRAWSGRITRYDVTDSTNERALAAIANGEARHGDVFVAREQTRGRGRRGATWHSPPGEGLYFSIALLPRRPVSPPALTMASGLAVWRALRALGLLGVELKWPNDLFVGRAKLVGILVETRGLDPRAPHYVVGVGINVAQRTFAPELLAERAVTSLALCGVERSTDDVLRAALAELEPALERAVRESEAAPSTSWDTARTETTAREYAEAAGLLGARVCVEAPQGEGPRGEIRGRLRDLETCRGLELELELEMERTGSGSGTGAGTGADTGAAVAGNAGAETSSASPDAGRAVLRWIPLEHVRALTKL